MVAWRTIGERDRRCTIASMSEIGADTLSDVCGQ